MPDGSLQRPQLLADRELDAENGRGMSLVTAMSTDWCVAATPMGGKSTWAAFDTQSATPPSEGLVGAPDGTCPADRDSAGQVGPGSTNRRIRQVERPQRPDLGGATAGACSWARMACGSARRCIFTSGLRYGAPMGWEGPGDN